MIVQNINSRQILTFSHWRVSDSISLIVGLFALFSVNVGGQLFVSEVLLILLAPVLWWQRGRLLLRNADVIKIITLGPIWFIGQAITDLIRQTALPDLMRGWAGIIVLLICFSSLYLLLGNSIRRIIIFACGYAMSGLLSPFIQPSTYYIIEPWKFGFGAPVILLTFLFVIIVSRGQLKWMRKWLWLIMAVGALSFFLNARSLGGITILSGAILWLRSSPFSRWIFTRLRVKNLFITGLLLLGISWGLLEGYAYLAGRGLLGQQAMDKLEMQHNDNVWGLILGGRTEILASSRAILDSPIIGHGSWAKDGQYRILLYQLANLGYQTDIDQLDYYINGTDLIPAHSHITQSWVWAGVLGAIFWGWILVFVGKVFLRANITPNELYPLVIYLGSAAAWDILFSPFGSIMRLIWALRFVVFLAVRIQDEK